MRIKQWISRYLDISSSKLVWQFMNLWWFQQTSNFCSDKIFIPVPTLALFSFRQAKLFFIGGAEAPPAPLGRTPVVITWPGPGAITICIQVQKGGEVPTQGLRMQAPDKKGEKKYFRFRKNIISMTSSLQHAETDTISVTCGDSGACLAPVILICCTCPVLVTCKCTGFTLWASPLHE